MADRVYIFDPMNKGEKLLVVVADDDEDDQFLVKEAIGQVAPTEVISVYNGRELVEVLRNHLNTEQRVPDFILLDLNMPLLDGFTALQMIQLDERMKQIPVYILSTSRLDRDKSKSHELGARGFYTKPILFEHLKQIIEEIACRSQRSS